MSYIAQHEIVKPKSTGTFSHITARELLKDQIQSYLDAGASNGWKCVSVSVTLVNDVIGSGYVTGSSYDVVIVWDTPA
ncbi:MAG: hypothetical protein FWE76_07230 [Symbiobacteriaceae bacterium]|nr:hypothetical protein [Symbiobacteriaceae bacterium]